MITRSRAIAVLALAATALLAVPTTAQAADYRLWSTSGRSYVWFNDAADQISVCDVVSNDGVGAHAVVIGSQPRRERVVYNGCETFSNIGDGWWQDVTLCDWVAGDPLVGRYDKFCTHAQFQG